MPQEKENVQSPGKKILERPFSPWFYMWHVTVAIWRLITHYLIKHAEKPLSQGVFVSLNVMECLILELQKLRIFRSLHYAQRRVLKSHEFTVSLAPLPFWSYVKRGYNILWWINLFGSHDVIIPIDRIAVMILRSCESPLHPPNPTHLPRCAVHVHTVVRSLKEATEYVMKSL